MEYDVRFLGVDGNDFFDALKPEVRLSGSLLKMNVGENPTVIRTFQEEEISTVRKMTRSHCGLFDRLLIEGISGF